MNNNHTTSTQSVAASMLARNTLAGEEAKAGGVYQVTCVGPKEEFRAEYIRLQAKLEKLIQSPVSLMHRAWLFFMGISLADEITAMTAKMDSMLEPKWADSINNLVTDVGANDALDKYLSGSAYTAAWYLGLISLTGYTTGVAAGDTMASHGGWAEDVMYSNATRVAPSFAAAAARSKATSVAAAFNINGTTTTIKGCFLTSNSTKSGTTGILYSAGLFTGGDKAVAAGDTLNVTYTASLT